MKSTLIVHPDDRSTDFLRGLYQDLPDKTLITGGITKFELRKEIHSHALVIMCGHGSPRGLFGVNQFPDAYPYIIDDTMVSSLKNKPNTVYIWCDSNVFVLRHGLSGFHTGMFLSQMSECSTFRVDCTEEDIIESNSAFAETVAQHIHEPPIVFYKNVLFEYDQLAQTNPVARYNHTRLFLNRYEPHLFLDMVSKIQ